MAFSPGSSSSRAHRGRRSDIYSTVVIHGDGSDAESGSPPEEEDEEEEDASSLPLLLQRVPKDFGAAVDDDDDEEEESSLGFSDTVIVKRDARPSPSPTAPRRLRSPFLDTQRASPRSRSEPDDAYSTFLIRSTARAAESVSGTVVRRTAGGGGGGFGSSFMSGMVEGTRAGEPGGIGQFQFQWEEGRQQQQARRKASVSSVPESVTKEDPSTKYELLHELGKGSYGAVYKARDSKTSELVAVKVISLTEGEERYEEIRGEIEMLQQCSHPNVVRYFGSYQGEEYLWVAFCFKSSC